MYGHKLRLALWAFLEWLVNKCQKDKKGLNRVTERFKSWKCQGQYFCNMLQWLYSTIFVRSNFSWLSITFDSAAICKSISVSSFQTRPTPVLSGGTEGSASEKMVLLFSTFSLNSSHIDSFKNNQKHMEGTKVWWLAPEKKQTTWARAMAGGKRRAFAEGVTLEFRSPLGSPV